MTLHLWLLPPFKRLISYYQLGQCHHALLIHSLVGMGKEEFIHEIACFLMCQQTQEYSICGKCHSCNLMRAGTHPDYYIITSDNITLGISTVREITEKLYECPKLGVNKVVKIVNASILTQWASSALLKILEEPPKNTWFFLSCHDIKTIPITLRSRCCLYHLTIPQESWTLSWLKKKVQASNTTIITALRLCGGAPLAALTLLNNTSFIQREQLILFFQTAVESGDWLSLLVTLNNDQVTTYLYWIISLLVDALKVQYSMEMLIRNVDNHVLVNMLAHRFSNKALLTIAYNMFKCCKQLNTMINTNRELILANQLLHIENYLKKN